MAVYGLIFRRNVTLRVRIQAFLNLFCACYMVGVTVFTTFLGYFMILPLCVDSRSWVFLFHRIVAIYLFLSTIGNFCTCVFTDPSVRSDRSFLENLGVTEPCSQTTENNGDVIKRKASKMKVKRSTDEREGSRKSWCMLCKVLVEERMHHCHLCEKCVVKRDHHCFFMGVCIGRRNHQYFIYFLLFMGIGTMYALLMLAKFLNVMYGIRFYGPQTFITLFSGTVVTILKGGLPTVGFCLAFVLLYISLLGTVLAFGFFCWNMMIVACGQTTYEARRGIRKYSKGSYRLNIAEVFDRRSFVALLVPFYDLLRRK